MKYLIRFSLLIISAYIMSCGQTSTHEGGQTSSHKEDLIYYTTIAAEMKAIRPKVEAFLGQMKTGVHAANSNETHKLDKASLDSLREYFNRTISDLNLTIKIMGALKETDKDLDFKQTVLSYLTEVKQLQEAAIPVVLDMLENGVDKVTDKQKKALGQKFMDIGNKLDGKGQGIRILSLAYQKKHNITAEELKQYNL
jgi:hypothetical protein